MSNTIDRNVRPRTQAPPEASSQHSEGRTRRLLGWIIVPLAAAAAVLIPLTGASAAGQVVSLLAVALAAVQASRRYGWKLFVSFFVITYVVSTFFEALSIQTGFPFGNYYYTLYPQIFNVPIIIGFFYFGIGYVSWMTANTILDLADQRLDLRTRAGRVNVFALPVLAGSVMTMFDVGVDSIAATVRHTWIWEDGGGVFGVPVSNYLGWWFVTWAFFQIFTLVLARRQSRSTSLESTSLPGISFLQPVLVYLMFAVASVMFFFTYNQPEITVDATGMAWNTASIYSTLMVINLFTIVPVSLFAIAKIARGDLSRA